MQRTALNALPLLVLGNGEDESLCPPLVTQPELSLTGHLPLSVPCHPYSPVSQQNFALHLSSHQYDDICCLSYGNWEKFKHAQLIGLN